MRRFAPTTIWSASAALLIAICGANAQHAFEQTVTVDKSGRADRDSIQDAIDNGVPNNPTVRWTVLVYAGTYQEAVVLGDDKENVDIVGVDGDAVVIDPPADKDAITIKGLGARNNSIRNLTIVTNDDTADQGRGIVIEKEGTGSDPSAILIDGVTITCDGDESDGIHLADAANDLEIRNTRITCTGTDSAGIDFAGVITDAIIADCTIATSDGHGIRFNMPGVTAPSDILLQNVTIDAAGTQKNALDGGDAENVLIVGCTINAADGIGVDVGDDYQITGSTISSDASSSARPALRVTSANGLRVADSTFTARRKGLLINGSPASSDLRFAGSQFEASDTVSGSFSIEGINLTPPGDDIRFIDCLIVADGTDSGTTGLIFAIYPDFTDPTSDVVFQGCQIVATSAHPSANLRCVQLDNTENVRFVDCDFQAVLTNETDDDAKVQGIRSGLTSVTVIGGSITTAQLDNNGDPFDQATGVFDLVGDDDATPTDDHIYVAGTRFSKWSGPINAAGRPGVVTQQMIDVDPAGTAAILGATTLTGSVQKLSPGFQPDAYRVLSVTGTSGTTQDVYIVGTNWADDVIVEKITLSGGFTVPGKRPFKTVTTIILPASTNGQQQVKVGTTDRLGLYWPIATADDVIQWSIKASAETSYTIQPIGDLTIGDEGEIFATVLPDSISTDDSFQFTLETSR